MWAGCRRSRGPVGLAGLQEVEVIERLVYDACQLQAFIGSELPDTVVDLPEGETAAELAEQMTGKIWSAMFFARMSG